MKLDLFSWQEFASGVSVPWSGPLRLKVSEPSALYLLNSDGIEILAGFGASFDFDISGSFEFRVDGKSKARVFVDMPPDGSFRSLGEIFSNPDRLRHESGALREVRAALRVQQLESKRMMDTVRAETNMLKAERLALARSAPLPVAVAVPSASASSPDVADGQ